MLPLKKLAVALALALPLGACDSPTEPAPPEVLLVEDFNNENGGLYKLDYVGFLQWNVSDGTVDLVGTAPFDDFLPRTQRLYVDLDGTMRDGGKLTSKEVFDLPKGRYRLEFKMAGTPRDRQEPNTVNVAVGPAFTHHPAQLRPAADLRVQLRGAHAPAGHALLRAAGRRRPRQLPGRHPIRAAVIRPRGAR